MNKDSQSTRGSSLPDRLFRAFEEASTENDAVLREKLDTYGVDPDQVVEEGLKLVKGLLGQQKLVRAKGEYRRVRAAIQSLTQNAGDRAQDIRDRIARNLAGEGNEKLIRVYHRKLESLDAEDLASLDDEKKLLKLLRYLKETEE